MKRNGDLQKNRWIASNGVALDFAEVISMTIEYDSVKMTLRNGTEALVTPKEVTPIELLRYLMSHSEVSQLIANIALEN